MQQAVKTWDRAAEYVLTPRIVQSFSKPGLTSKMEVIQAIIGHWDAAKGIARLRWLVAGSQGKRRISPRRLM